MSHPRSPGQGPAPSPTIGISDTRDASRQLLLQAAKKLFAAKGLEGTTVKELADQAGVNVSLISYYFQGKEGLYRACIEQYGMERLAVAERILQPAQNVEELRTRLKMWATEMIDGFAKEFDETRIVMREIENGLPIARDVFERTHLKNINCLISFVAKAQENGLLRKDVDPLLTAAMLQSATLHFCRNAGIGERYFNRSLSDAPYREQIADHLIALFLDGILPSQSPRSPK